MYQSPNNQPDSNQSFYSDQTSQFSQQPPPPPSYPQPGQYPPLQQPYKQLPQRPLLAHQRSWRWYKRQRNPMKWSIGCLTLFIAFITCGTCIGTVNAFQNPAAQNQITATAVPTHAAQIIARISPAHLTATVVAARPTPTPIPKPTATPTHKPTAAPTAPPVVVAPPTHAPVPPQPPAPTAPPVAACGGFIDDGVCYSTNPAGGNAASTVPADFCTLVACVSTFWKDTNGSVAVCVNGKYTHSYGVSGACSRDGGVAGQLYRH